MFKLFIGITCILLLNSVSYSQTYDFELQDIEGNSVTLSSLLEKGPVLLQFWALWCVPCKEEMKIINDIWQVYKDSGFVYVSVNQDAPKSSAKVKSFVESKNYKFITLYDSELKVFEAYGGQNLPFSILLNRKGEIFKTYTGYLPGDEKKITEDITEVLKIK
jgi:peroxiredoxin